MPTGGSECGCSQDGGKRKKVASKKRGLSDYNKFMKTEIQKVKKENPKLTHQQAFKKAASNWKGKK
tara:strand:- start:1980 stop:2177 length:198 start_codon:yes stop_codon:yes gene_type:complete